VELETKELNWAGNLEYRASELLYPTSIEQLQEQVRAASKVRVLGSRHSFNDIADTSETMISLAKMPQVIDIDAQAMNVRVSGGITYGALADALHAAGFALHNLASLPHISVAGAVSTGTHGSGEAHGNLATAVSAVELVLADGSQLSVNRNDPEFNGYVVSLGALGVITHLTLDIVPSFDVQQTVYEQLSWDKVLDNFDGIQASAYSVSLFTDWSGDLVVPFSMILIRENLAVWRRSLRCTHCPEPMARSAANSSGWPGLGPIGSPISAWTSCPVPVMSCRPNIWFRVNTLFKPLPRCASCPR